MPRVPLSLLLCCLLMPLLAQAQCPGVTTQLTPFATEKLTVSTTAKGLTASVYQPPGTTPALAQLSVGGGDICFSVVGTPTLTDCHPVASSGGTSFPICGVDSIKAFKMITLNTDANLFVTYYKFK